MKRTTIAIAALLFGLVHLAQAQPLPESAVVTTTPTGLQFAITTQGKGAQPMSGQVVVVHYRGTFMNGKEFDSSHSRNDPFAFTLGRKQVIKGWDEAFAMLRVGDKASLIVPPELAYGDKQRGPIPANSTLRFDVEVLDVKPLGLADVLSDLIDAEGLEAGRKRFDALKAAKFDGVYVSETQLNGLGYRFMGKDKLPEALAVLRWAIELSPQSGNLYDSLGEVQRKAGQREAAIQSYEKSLVLDPKNDNAKKVLADLKASK
ncbi:MAG: FKBP-type peptidyl-prolyl cis-trans isomerase [Rhodoferax sp.]|nr:FKBP-type peptidyl-prolyl cis-trans isomerase [Rhodoferax sp.]